jgi:hypothetical protein
LVEASDHIPCDRRASSTSSWVQPEKQWTRILSSASVIDRLGLLSSWAGQQAVYLNLPTFLNFGRFDNLLRTEAGLSLSTSLRVSPNGLKPSDPSLFSTGIPFR